ncbi:MAG: malto-oligosyltrehalose synthase, partial [Desulfomonilia bacterium]
MQHLPRATYRVQLNRKFTFDDAAGILDYLADLGVSHLYASPCLQAAQGSTHGYDVVDHTRANSELGGQEGFERLVAALKKAGMGMVLDIVPNHMAISGGQNRWWWDVLENGQSSRYAPYFDVDWDPAECRFGTRILLPILGDHFGRVLEQGEIRMERTGGRFSIRYHDQVFPASPHSLASLLARTGEAVDSPELCFLADCLSSLPQPSAGDREGIHRRHRDKEAIHALMERILAEHPELARLLDSLIAEINEDPDALESILDSQNYRLAYWRTAGQDLGYRRFFDIDTLVGLHVEDGEVFEDTHRLVLEWLHDGIIEGMRVDHPDGLRDPSAYLARLRRAGPESWILVEKILQPGEPLRPEWPVDGTTGYDFVHLVTHLLADADGSEPLTRLYREFTSEAREYAEVLLEKKHLVIDSLFGSDLNRLATLMLSICERHRRYRDYTRRDILKALRALIAAMPVYRTYVNAATGWIAEIDRRLIARAIESVSLDPEVDPELLGFIGGVLTLKVTGGPESEFVMRFQQLTPPVMAKGAEDTAFYVYNRFIAFNEVGGHPGSFGIDIETFHRAMLERSRSHPFTMLATSTHDTKRSEDVRARLAVLSEIPEQWREAVLRFSELAERHRTGDLPDRNTEYFLYQTIAGAWPIGPDRLLPYLQKAAREARTYTSWIEPDPEYEEALRSFAASLLLDREFTREMDSFAGIISGPGFINSLTQTVLKLTACGIPDIYQGSELWDLSLVDPDNRRPVDYALRRGMLAQARAMRPGEIAGSLDSGLPKLWVVHQGLMLRRDMPEAFGEKASYEPLEVTGPKSDHALG